MSTTAEIDYLDGEFSVQENEPSTLLELTSLIGEQGVIDETVSNLRYRNKYPRVYKIVSREIGELGFAKPVKEEKTNKDGTIKKIHVSDMDHAREFLKADPETHRPILQDLFSKVGSAEALYVKGERAGGGGKISQAALDAANGFFALGDDIVEEKVTIIENLVPGYKVGRDSDGAATPESVARGVMALNRFLQKQAQNAALGALK